MVGDEASFADGLENRGPPNPKAAGSAWKAGEVGSICDATKYMGLGAHHHHHHHPHHSCRLALALRQLRPLAASSPSLVWVSFIWA